MTARTPIWSAAILVVLLGAGGLWLYGRPAYRQYRESHALEQAKRFMDRRDFRNASLSANRALLTNPRNLEACHIQVALAEMARSPAMLDWCRRIAEIEPSLENRLRVAAAGLRVETHPYPLAAAVLEDLKAPAKDLPAYHVMAAELALKLNDLAEATREFQQASRLEPGNPLHRINLAVLGLQATNQQAAADARLELERLSADAQARPLALRWLVADSLKRSDPGAARSFSDRLVAHPRATFGDRLQHLAVLQQADPAECESVLEGLQNAVTTNLVAIYELSAWMSGRGLAANAMAWLTNFPPDTRARQPVPLAFVEAYVALNDWTGLEAYLQAQQWADLDFLRLAFLSRAASEQRQERAADTRWRSAVHAASDRLGPLAALLSLAGAWGSGQRAEDLLWQIAQRFPRERWTWQELARRYSSAGNTRGLHRLYSFISSCRPRDFIAQNNFAATSLLLNLDLPRAHKTARTLYAQRVEEPVIASTYAYSLALQGRAPEALAILEKLKSEALETPAIALYYGYLLAKTGHRDKAQRYLELATNAPLLPEERTLLAQARGAPFEPEPREPLNSAAPQE